MSRGGTWIWQQSNACSDCLSECSGLTHMKFPSVSENRFLHLIYSQLFSSLMDIPSILQLLPRSHHFWTWLKNLNSSTVCSPKVSLKFWKFLYNFCLLENQIYCRHAVLSSLPFSRHTQITSGTKHTRTEQDITQESHVLQPYSMQELTLQTPATNSSVIILSVITRCIPHSHILFFHFQHKVILQI